MRFAADSPQSAKNGRQRENKRKQWRVFRCSAASADFREHSNERNRDTHSRGLHRLISYFNPVDGTMSRDALSEWIHSSCSSRALPPPACLRLDFRYFAHIAIIVNWIVILAWISPFRSRRWMTQRQLALRPQRSGGNENVMILLIDNNIQCNGNERT